VLVAGSKVDCISLELLYALKVTFSGLPVKLDTVIDVCIPLPCITVPFEDERDILNFGRVAVEVDVWL
jgi:hypothetical protein